LAPGPVVNDLVTWHRQRLIGVNVVEVAKAEQDVVDRLLRVFGLEARDKQCQALVGSSPRPLLDRHQVEVIAQLTAITDHLKLHGHKVAESGDVQPVDFSGGFKQVLGPGLVGVQELHLGSGEDAVKRSR